MKQKGANKSHSLISLSFWKKKKKPFKSSLAKPRFSVSSSAYLSKGQEGLQEGMLDTRIWDAGSAGMRPCHLLTFVIAAFPGRLWELGALCAVATRREKKRNLKSLQCFILKVHLFVMRSPDFYLFLNISFYQKERNTTEKDFQCVARQTWIGKEIKGHLANFSPTPTAEFWLFSPFKMVSLYCSGEEWWTTENNLGWLSNKSDL